MMVLLIVCPIAHSNAYMHICIYFIVCSKQTKQMINGSKRAVSLSNRFFFFYCNNLGNKAKDSVGTGELYFLSDAIMLILSLV